MAGYKQRFEHVVLNEKDIPGAILPFKNVSSNSVTALKRWLETRGLSMTGSKAQLVQRVEACIDADLPIDVKLDSGKWYDLKIQSQTANHTIPSLQPPVPPVTGWGDFPSVAVPKYFNKGQIYHYLVETATFTDGSDSVLKTSIDVKTEKPLKRGMQFFKSGHIQSMKDCTCTNQNLYYVKCVARASFENTAYSVLAAIDPRTGFVRDASCDCKASAMGRCSHVAGLLYAVSDYLDNYGSEACTSKPCEWNKGRKTLRSPKKLNDCHVKENRKFITLTFDPRPLENRENNDDIVEKFKATLSSQTETTGWHLIFGKSKMERSDNDKIVEDYTLDEESKSVLKEKCQSFLLSLIPPSSQEKVTEIVSFQGNEEWMRERRIRITASNCKAVKTAKTEETKTNLIKRLLWAAPVFSKQMEYGHDQEQNAFAAYKDHLLLNDKSCHVTQSGLWVNPSFPELACSPDGIVRDANGNARGVLEIKCPYSLADHPVEDFDCVLSKQQQSNFCLNRTDCRQLRLKRNHAYYFQVQMQMGVMQTEWCDFFVWTKKIIFY